MGAEADPFLHHPELRDKIIDPLKSPSRAITTAKFAALAKSLGLPVDRWYSDSEREAERAQFLADCTGADLWVFGYGSLMWDLAFRFEDVRRARVASYARRFILIMGTSLDYLRNIARQFAALGIQDDEVSELLRQTEPYLRS